jgi:hypothetical protein
MMLDNPAELVKQLDGMVIRAGCGRIVETTYSDKDSKAHKPVKRRFKDREFELRLTSANRNVAKREAKKFRKRGFHTRVIESSPGVFSVYRCLKRAA